jgi:hypothetical protein
MHPIFEAVYDPAYNKADNAQGRVFQDVEDLGLALKLAMEKEAVNWGGVTRGLSQFAGRLGKPAVAGATKPPRTSGLQVYAGGTSPSPPQLNPLHTQAPGRSPLQIQGQLEMRAGAGQPVTDPRQFKQRFMQQMQPARGDTAQATPGAQQWLQGGTPGGPARGAHTPSIDQDPTMMLPGKVVQAYEKIARLKAAARVINADVGLDQIINHMKKARAKKAVEKTANVKDFGMTLAKKALQGSAFAKDKALRGLSRDRNGPLNDVERLVASPTNKVKQRPRLRELLAYAKQYRDKKPLNLVYQGRPEVAEPTGLLEKLKAQLANPKNTQAQRSALRAQLAKAQPPAGA